MAEQGMTRANPLHGLALPVRIGLVAVEDAGRATRLVYRGAPEHLGDAFGVPLPTAPCRAHHDAGRAALWLGPDEWLLLAEADQPAMLRATLETRLAGKPASLVDVGHRNVGLIVTGPKAELLLSSGCPLDLDLAAFPVGMCTRTLLAKAEIVLWRTAPDTFRLEIWRSFAPYVAGLLGEAAREIA